MPDKPPVPARPRPVKGTKEKAKASAVDTVQTNVGKHSLDESALEGMKNVALDASRRIKHLLARGLATRPKQTKENTPLNASPSVLLTKFRVVQTDLAERDKTVDALKDMLRRGGAPDAAIDRHVDRWLFPGLEVAGDGGVGVPTVPTLKPKDTQADKAPVGIAPGSSRELMEREINRLRGALAERDGVMTNMTSIKMKKGGGGDFAARDELNKLASMLERIGSSSTGGGRGTGDSRRDGSSSTKHKDSGSSSYSKEITRSNDPNHSTIESRLAEKIENQTWMLQEWTHDESRRLREELSERIGEARFAKEQFTKANDDLLATKDALEQLRVTHVKATAESKATLDAAKKASEVVANSLRETLQALHETLTVQGNTTEQTNANMEAFEHNSKDQIDALRGEMLKRLDLHTKALDDAAADEQRRREEYEKVHAKDEETFAMLCESAALSASEASKSSENASKLLQSIASNVVDVKTELSDANKKLTDESDARALSFRTSLAAATDASNAVKDVRLNQRKLLAAHLEAKEMSETMRERGKRMENEFKQKEADLNAKLLEVQTELNTSKIENELLKKQVVHAQAIAGDAADARYVAELDAAKAAEAANATRDAALREIIAARNETLTRLKEARVVYDTEARVFEAKQEQRVDAKEVSDTSTPVPDSDFSFEPALVRVRLEYPGLKEREEREEKSRSEHEKDAQRASQIAARVAAATLAQAEAEQHAKARSAAEADAREAGRMLREVAADLSTAWSEIRMLRNMLRRRVGPGDLDEAWDATVSTAVAETREVSTIVETTPEVSTPDASLKPSTEHLVSSSARPSSAQVSETGSSSSETEETRALRTASKEAREKLEQMLASAKAFETDI